LLVGNKQILLHPNVYNPCDDSMLLSNYSRQLARGRVLDMGTGTGIQAVVAAEKADTVLALDVSDDALKLAKQNAQLNRTANVEFRKSNLFQAVKPDEKFDLIIFNPPYLPTLPCERIRGPLDAAWNGGIDGRRVIGPFLVQFPKHLAKGGALLMLHCNLADTDKTVDTLKEMGFSVKKLEEARFFNERLSVLYATLPDNPRRA